MLDTIRACRFSFRPARSESAPSLRELDRPRPAFAPAQRHAGRRLFLKLWYPAERGTGDDDERIWQDLRNDARTPAVVPALLGCMRARTATRVNGRFVARAPTSSVVAYNHGSVSFAAENTSLMQELASHGYTVVAIQHAEQLAEFKALGRADSPEKKKADAERAQLLKEAPECRAVDARGRELPGRDQHQSCGRGKSSRYVVRAEPYRQRRGENPQSPNERDRHSSAHLVGFSLGGAVATETAKRDARALSVVNLDGGMYGTLDRRRRRASPYLMSVQQLRTTDERQAAPQHAQRVAPPDTTHLNYHDIAGLVRAAAARSA